MNEAEEKAVELAGYITTASNQKLERVVERLIRTDPRLVEAVRRQLSVVRPVFETDTEKAAYDEGLSYLHSILSDFLTTSVALGAIEAPTLAAATGEALGEGSAASTVLTGVAAAATLSLENADEAMSPVVAAAMERTLEGLDTKIIEAQKKNGAAVAAYEEAVQRKHDLMVQVQADPNAVNENGEKLSLKLRGPDKQLPRVERTDLEAFDFLLERGTDAATNGRQESELYAAEMETTEGNEPPRFVLVADSGACKICKTVAGDGFLGSGTLFLHDSCGCTIRITRRGEDDPVYKYNVKNHGAQAQAAKKKAMERWQLTEEEVNSDQFYALALGEAFKV